MSNTFFIGDMHIGHANAIRFDLRPFKTVEEMDAELIRRWKAKVRPEDTVYVLGDMFWKTRSSDAHRILQELPGRIILIKGNHDYSFLNNSKAVARFDAIKERDDICVTLKDGTKRRCILDHYFVPMYNGHRYHTIHLHAHSHVSEEAQYELEFAKELNEKGFRNEIYNVGCMYWNYEPVTLDEILAAGTERMEYVLAQAEKARELAKRKGD